MPVITISNQFGAGGPEIGRELARRMGLDYLDKEILHRVALEVNVSHEEVQEFEEEYHSKFRSFFSTIFDLDALKKKARVTEEILSSEYDERDTIPFHYQVDGWIDSDIYKQMVRKVITALGERGNVVIKGRGGQVILKDNPHTLHVRVVAELDDRVRWTAKRRNMGLDEARSFVQKLDARSHDYLRFYFDVDPDQPTLYHLVLNTSRIPQERCVDLLENLARELAQQEAPDREEG